MGFLTKSWEHSELFMQQYLSKCFTPNLPSLRCGTMYLMGSSFRAERGDPGRVTKRRYWGQCGLGCVVLAACVVPLTRHMQEAVAAEMRSLTEVAFR